MTPVPPPPPASPAPPAPRRDPAAEAIGRLTRRAFLVGGCESKINPLSFTRHNTFQPLSRRNDEPQKALRPFDADRAGTVLGEGAAVTSLEELDFARGRGATILGELVAFAAGFDRGLKGPILAGVIRNALRQAGITIADVDHVNAAASGSIGMSSSRGFARISRG